MPVKFRFITVASISLVDVNDPGRERYERTH